MTPPWTPTGRGEEFRFTPITSGMFEVSVRDHERTLRHRFAIEPGLDRETQQTIERELLLLELRRLRRWNREDDGVEWSSVDLGGNCFRISARAGGRTRSTTYRLRHGIGDWGLDLGDAWEMETIRLRLIEEVRLAE